MAKLDLMAICGSATDISVLEEAGAKEAEAIIAVTDSDEVNLVACGIAASKYAPMAFPAIKKGHITFLIEMLRYVPVGNNNNFIFFYFKYTAASVITVSLNTHSAAQYIFKGFCLIFFRKDRDFFPGGPGKQRKCKNKE